MLRQIVVVGLGVMLAGLPAAAGPANLPGEYRNKPLASLLEDLGGPDWLRQTRAAQELGRRGPQHLPAVLALLSSDNPHARRGACDAIAAMAAGVRVDPKKPEEQEKKVAVFGPAVGPLMKLLAGNEDAWVRNGAAEALAGLDRVAVAVAGQDFVQLLVKVLLNEKEDPWTLRSVYRIFGRSSVPKDGLDPQTVLAIHLHASRFMDIMFRGGSLQAIAKMGPDAAPAVPTLMEYLEDFYRTGKDNRRGIWTMRALGAIGAASAPALPLLRKIADEGPQGVMPKYGTPRNVESAKNTAAQAIEQIQAAMKKAGAAGKPSL